MNRSYHEAEKYQNIRFTHLDIMHDLAPEGIEHCTRSDSHDDTQCHASHNLPTGAGDEQIHKPRNEKEKKKMSINSLLNVNRRRDGSKHQLGILREVQDLRLR